MREKIKDCGVQISRVLGEAVLLCSILAYASEGSGAPLQKAVFVPEASRPSPHGLAPPSPSFEGKAFRKDSLGNYVPLRRPRTPGFFTPSSHPASAGSGTVDFYLQDGSETSLAVNYVNNQNLVAAYNEGWDFDPDIPHSNSTNGSGSWSNRTFPNGGGTYTGYPFDPWVNAGNSAGEFFSSQIRNDASSTNNTHSIISRSTNGGTGFLLFYEQAKEISQDRSMVEVDKSNAWGGGTGTTHDGKVYLCYDDFGSGGAGYFGSFLQVVSPAGAALTEIQISGVGAPPFRGSQMQPVAGTTDGAIYIQATAISGGGATVFANFHEITNGGAGPNIFIKSSMSWPPAGQQLGVMSRWGLNGHRIDNHGFLDIDRSTGPRRGHLFFISNRNPNPGNPALDQGDIHLSLSTNGAGSWSTAVLPTETGKTQYFPMLDVDDDGNLHIAYYQNETGAVNGGVLNGSSANLYYTLSTDGGSNWTVPVQVNTASNTLDFEDPPPDRSAANYYLIGDYAQLRAGGTGGNTKVYILWSGYDKDRANSGVGDLKQRVYCTTLKPFPCAAGVGDLDNDSQYTPQDIVLLLTCVFAGTGNCDLCFVDVDCDGGATPADVVLELSKVFTGLNDPPWCGP